MTRASQGFQHWWPDVVPNGKVLFALVSAVAPENQQIAALSLKSGEQKVLLPGTFPRYMTSRGDLVYSVGGALYLVKFDADRLAARGDPVRVLDQVVTKSLGAVDFGLSANGTLVYIPSAARGSTQRRLAWVDRKGREELLTEARPFYQLALSPDGSRAAALAIEPTNHDIWVYDLTGRNSTRLTFNPASDIAPLWTADGRRIVFASTRDGGHYNLFWKAADGTGVEERLTTSSLTQYPMAWSPSGTLIFTEQSLETGYDLLELGITGERRPRVLLRTPFNETLPAFAPDGKWLAYQSDETGQYEIYVRPFPDLQSGQWQVSVGGGIEPLWGLEGHELIYRSGPSLMTIHVETAPRFVSSAPQLVVQGAYLFGGPGRKYDIAPGKDRFLLIKAGTLPTEIVLVQNWSKELDGALARR